jgi:thiol:disulfide interchange protein DsbA
MRSIRFAFAAVSLIASSAFASPSALQNGVDYTTLAVPQPSQVVGKKVEVIEFIAYHCPACNAMEPYVDAWVKKQGDKVNFRRMHVAFSGPNDPEAHLFLTLEAMGKGAEYNSRVFRAFHIERKRLLTEQAIVEWAVASGLNKTKFLEMWNSFGVLTKLKRLPSLVSSYRVDATPSFVVDGKYLTSPSTVDAANKNLSRALLPDTTLATIDALVAKVQKDKGYGPAAPAVPVKAAPVKAAPVKPAPAKTASK